LAAQHQSLLHLSAKRRDSWHSVGVTVNIAAKWAKAAPRDAADPRAAGSPYL
jgi:hypothetical protein